MNDQTSIHTRLTTPQTGRRLSVAHREMASQSAPNHIGSDCVSITPEMLGLIEINQKQIDAIVETVPGGVRNIQDIYPLSPLQDGMLFHHLLNERSDTYVLSTLFELQSHLQVDLLISSIQKVIDRHDILRSAVLWQRLPRPVQVVYRRVTMPVEELVLDKNRDPIEQIEATMRPGLRRMDLGRPPLMGLLIAMDPRSAQCYAVLHVHHLVCDHQSLRTVVAEAMECAAGRVEELPVPASFRNHVAHTLASASAQDDEAFFRGKLGDIDEPTAPFGLLDVHGVDSQIEEARLAVRESVAQKLRVQARRFGVSAARLFHAAWGLVVAHTSGRDDVVYGTVLLARRVGSAPIQRMLGMSVNTLPLRLRLQGMTAEGLVEQTCRELVELLRHEMAPLTLAQRCSGIVDTAPIFTSLLNYRHSHDPETEQVSGVGIRVLARREAWTNYPVTLTVDDLGEGFVLTAHTDRRIDPKRMVRYMCRALESLVDALKQAPQTPALALSIVPESERRQVMNSFNATQERYSENKLIHEIFEEQVQRTPNAVAIVYERESLTYAELNDNANQLARYLRSMGVGPDQLVGICVERSFEMMVGLLGILKAGGAYVPLDPNYPADRLQYMVDDASPRVVLMQEKLRSVLPPTNGKVIALDTKLKELVGNNAEKLSSADLGLSAQNLVYVIYTSGSTGRPKGTGMSHRSMSNLIDWHRKIFRAHEGQRVLQFAALGFDVAFQEIFSTLCAGGTLVLLDEWVRRDARALMELLRSQRIERLFLPPLVLQSLAEYFKAGSVELKYLQDVITAGEQLRISPEIVHLFNHLDGCRLHNHYGPTETHVVTTITMSGRPSEWPTLPTIGRPVANTKIYILDGQQRVVPLGIIGEIYIGGANVARGYLNRPALTSERFVRDPFNADLQARMYRTGDLGRWRADGMIEYLGRNDDQVKIRGFRIELGEIEAQLVSHEQVKEAAVIAREEVPGEKRLVAYVTKHVQSSLNVDGLREHLQEVLPEHMVPSAFVVLESFPLTPSGKLNRRALPAPKLDAYVSRQYEAPRGEVEKMLAGIWQELLHVEQVGRQDNFFRLGGHSMSSLSLIVKVAEAFGIQLSAAAVFQYPDLGGMAQVIEMLIVDNQQSLTLDETEQEEGVIVS